MTNVMIPEAAIDAAAKLKLFTLEILERAQGIEIHSEPMRVMAVEWLATARKAIKDADAQRLALTAPLRDQVEAINRLFADVMERVKMADEAIDRKLVVYQKELNAKAEAERQEKARLDREAAVAAERERVAVTAVADAQDLPEFLARGDVADAAGKAADDARKAAEAVPAYTPPPAKSVATSRGTGTVKTWWTYEIENPDAIPREFCKPDPTLLMAAVRRGVRKIEGARIFEDSSTAVRGR